MKLWADFMDHVLTHLKGAPVALVENEIRNAAVRFCERAPVWIEDFEPESVTAEDEDFHVHAPERNTDLVRVAAVWFDGAQLIYKTHGELAVLFDHWRALTGVPQFWTQLRFDRITLVPRQNVSGVDFLRGMVQVKPAAAATGVPDEVFSQWRLTIANGALAALFAMPEKPWSNSQLAQYHAGMFNAETVAATAKVSGA